MKYVMTVEIDDELLEGDESIEHAVSTLYEILDAGTRALYDINAAVTIRPLSEEIAC